MQSTGTDNFNDFAENIKSHPHICVSRWKTLPNWATCYHTRIRFFVWALRCCNRRNCVRVSRTWQSWIWQIFSLLSRCVISMAWSRDDSAAMIGHTWAVWRCDTSTFHTSTLAIRPWRSPAITHRARLKFGPFALVIRQSNWAAYESANHRALTLVCNKRCYHTMEPHICRLKLLKWCINTCAHRHFAVCR